MDAQKTIHEWGPFLTGGGETTLFVARLREFLTDEQIARVLQTIDHTCTVCWNDDDGCQCWNDE